MKNWRLLILALVPFLICCKKQDTKDTKPANSNLTFNNVVILGNSISYAPHNTAIGWNGDWGMAATAQELDYAHLLNGYFKIKNPDVQLSIKNIVPFEVDPAHYDFDTELKELRDKKPDLLIIRIGENVPSGTDMQMFNERYTSLINYFKTGNTNIIVLSGASVWSDNVDDLVEKHPPYVLLKALLKDASNFSVGLFADPGVAGHPSNKGMQTIATLLWNKIATLTPDDRK